MKEVYTQDSVHFLVANDILSDKYFGLSIEQQIDNFSFGKDRGANVAFRQKLHRYYFKGWDTTSHCSQEAHRASPKKKLNDRSDSYSILYLPKFPIAGCRYFRSESCFSKHYEWALEMYPINEKSYFSRAKSHFTNITFQADCGSTLYNMGDGGIQNFSVAITKCLSALNKFEPSMRIPQDLDIIGHMAGFECTPQGSNGKGNMKFSFPEISNNDVNCEYHLKPHSSNDSKDSKHYHKRIYFTFAEVNGDIKTFVASIGPHL